MHHGTCVTHVSWCMSGSLTRCDRENVPDILGACATRNFTDLARSPLLLKKITQEVSHSRLPIYSPILKSRELSKLPDLCFGFHKFSSLTALKIVKITAFNAARDENFVKMPTFLFQWAAVEPAAKYQRHGTPRLAVSIGDLYHNCGGATVTYSINDVSSVCSCSRQQNKDF